MRNIHGLADYDLGGQADIPTPVVSKSGTAVVIPSDDVEEARGVLEMCLGQGPSTLTLAGLARAVMDDHAGRVIEYRREVADLKKDRGLWKDLADTYKESFETSNEAVKTSSETVKGLLDERLAIMERITDWENAYQGRRAIEADLTSRVAQLVNAYGSLYQSACEADKAHRGQDELLREVDVLGAYLKNPARETEAETRQMAVKAALTKIEEQDETIGALQQALVAARNGQPRRPTGAQGWSEGITENHPIMTWFEKEFVKRLCADLDLDLDKMRRLFDKK